jgi:hypothetical protein
MNKYLFILMIGSILMASMTGCNFPVKMNPETPTPQNTETISIVQTNAIQTMVAVITETARILPSLTASATSTSVPVTPTAEITPKPTKILTSFPTTRPTGIVLYNWPTITPMPKGYQCGLANQVPHSRQTYGPGADFDLKVTLQNTGTETWTIDEVDFRYLRGTKMQKKFDSVNISADVNPRATTDITIDMLAPHETGNYTAVWALMHRDQFMCAVLVDITVQP